MSVLALIQVRNEERALPGWLSNVADWVDGIVALNDNSEDSTFEILRQNSKVIEILQGPERPSWDERANQVALVEAGRRHGATWLLCLDADERLERAFGPRLGQLLEEADRDGISALAFRLRELWGARHQYRADGVWGRKVVYRLFRNDPNHRRFDPRRLHRSWMPLEIASELSVQGRQSGFNLYHLKMITPAGRKARVARYKKLDPNHMYQQAGYDYLVDESGLELERVPHDRDFLPPDDPAAQADLLTALAD